MIPIDSEHQCRKGVEVSPIFHRTRTSVVFNMFGTDRGGGKRRVTATSGAFEPLTAGNQAMNGERNAYDFRNCAGASWLWRESSTCTPPV